MLSAALAGHFGVPVVLVTGDDVAIEEAKSTIGPHVVAVATKRAIGYHSADSLSPDAAHAAIRDGARAALSRLEAAKPYRIPGPVRLEIAFKAMLNAEVLVLLPIVTRVDGSTIAFTGKDITEISRFIAFVTNYDSNL